MAMIVAPILAILSYFLVDLLVKEPPQKALAGEAYQLIAQSNCRFNSGQCSLKNGSFTSTVRVSSKNGKQLLHLRTANRLQKANIGFVGLNGVEAGPFDMLSTNANGTTWVVEFNVPIEANTLLRVALLANGAHYYAETTMGFSNYQTSFNQDFRNK